MVGFVNYAITEAKKQLARKQEATFFGEAAGTPTVPAGLGDATNSTLVAHGGAADITYDDLVAQRATLLDNFADITNLKLIISPTLEAVLISKYTGVGASEKTVLQAMKDLGVKVEVCQYLPAPDTYYFGDLSGVCVNYFMDLGMKYDNITLAKDAQVQYIFNQEHDWLNVYPKAVLKVTGALA